MVNRVQDPEVRALIPSTSIGCLNPFIDAANAMVNRLSLSDCGVELSDGDLEQVEKWLSAHYASVSDPSLSVTSQKFENASKSFSRGNSSSMGGVMSTQYGQMANSLSGGCLVEFDLKKASFFTVGGDCE